MIKTTTNYNQFSHMDQNRDVNMDNRKAKNLAQSMQEYGWLDAFPLMAQRHNGRLVVIDGQHRLAVAREYGIPVKYVVEKQSIDVAKLNDTSHSWTIEDFARRYAKEGVDDYVELIAFSEHYGISVNMSCGILSNTFNPGNVLHRLKVGTWKITSRPMANSVAECYKNLYTINRVFHKINALKVLWACFQLPYFDPDRLIAGAKRQAGEIKSVTKLELFYELFEEVYNKGKRDKHPLRFDAERALKARSAIKSK